MKRLNKLFLATILGFLVVSSDVLAMERDNIDLSEIDLPEALARFAGAGLGFEEDVVNMRKEADSEMDLAAQKQRHLDVLVNLAKKSRDGSLKRQNDELRKENERAKKALQKSRNIQNFLCVNRNIAIPAIEFLGAYCLGFIPGAPGIVSDARALASIGLMGDLARRGLTSDSIKKLARNTRNALRFRKK